MPADSETLVLQTTRSHDQWNTTICSRNDRYRRIKNLRKLVFLDEADVAARGLPHCVTSPMQKDACARQS
ncbi:hypothetical protein B9M81_03970 [Mycobacteroides abscessus]|nr:hypothetical protein CAK77_04155 [Mycobacteroides abscessus subsp. massiliense]OTQ97218.1 hypothetical protein B9M86_03975 [Mycobacteroides abscessus]TKV38369.1 hypothetical protein CFA71_15165 [Mycobacteroides abscessus subsp. bolletii]OTR10552.1 hypothetical protein B9M83_04320 [Mycobacteroides abscessus]OTR17305.1 hypothetical protein B9M82_04900 [Mycobacteroides abscessus]